MQTTAGLLVGIILGSIALAVLWLAVWFVKRSAYEPHHGKEAGESLAPGVGDRHATSPASLFITTTGGGMLRFDLTGSPVHVGRAPDNEIVITEIMPGWETTSRRHAQLYYDTRLERWVVGDEDSQNGVYVGDVRTGHNILWDGTRLSFGSVKALFRETN